MPTRPGEAVYSFFTHKGIFHPRQFGSPVALDLGSGHGEFLVQSSKDDPTKFWMGVEKKRYRVKKTGKRILREKIENILVVHANIFDFLDYTEPASFERIYILFPDPWQKRRWKRRRFLLNRMETIAGLLEPGGRLCIATDHRPSYDAASNAARNGALEIVPGEARAKTRYEKQWMEENREIFETWYRRK